MSKLEDVMREVWSKEKLEATFAELDPLCRSLSPIPPGTPFPSYRRTWWDRIHDHYRRACWRLGLWLMER